MTGLFQLSPGALESLLSLETAGVTVVSSVTFAGSLDDVCGVAGGVADAPPPNSFCQKLFFGCCGVGFCVGSIMTSSYQYLL
jgi:hypothetical protein